jgi:ribosomal protein S27E
MLERGMVIHTERKGIQNHLSSRLGWLLERGIFIHTKCKEFHNRLVFTTSGSEILCILYE